MLCPYCKAEMTKGVIQSARQIFFSTEERLVYFRKKKDDIALTNNWGTLAKTAYSCPSCKKIIIDYKD